MEGWPLVGRDEEVARIGGWVSRRRGVLLAGPPGVGKTRLIDEVVTRATSEGTAVITLVASRSSADIPLGCCSALLRASTDVAGGMAGVRQSIRDAAEGRRVLVAVDDAHWLDDATAALAHQLVAANEVTVLAAVRDDEPIPAPLTALWKDGFLERIELLPLEPDAVVALLEQVLGGQVERGGALRLAARCGGNALFLQELLDEAMRLGLIEQRQGVFLVRDPPARSRRLAELVAAHIGDLAAADREALELVALAEPLDLAALERLAGVRDAEALEQRGLVRLLVDGERHEVRLAHPLLGDVVRVQLPALRRRRLLRALADDLEAHGVTRRGDSLRLALLRLDAGEAAAAPVLMAAASEAILASGGAVAERLARAAHEAEPSFASATLLARILFELGRYEEQRTILEAAAEMTCDDVERSFVAIARAGNHFWGIGDGDAAREVLARAQEAATSPAARAEIRATRALYETNSGAHIEALALAETVDPDDPLLTAAYVQASLARALSLPRVGRADEAIDVIDDALGRCGDTDALTIYSRGLFHVARANALLDLGRLDEARDLAIAGYDAAINASETSTQGFFAICRGWIELHGGQLNEAIRYLREAVVAFAEQSHLGPERWACGGLLFAAGLARDKEVAAIAARSLEELGPHPAGIYDVGLGRARAWAALAVDEPAAARAELMAAAELARARGLPPEEAGCLHDLVRLGDFHEVAPRLEALADRCAGPVVRTMAAHAAGLSTGNADAIEAAGEAFADMGFLLKAAEAAMSAAETAARAGDRRRSSRLAQRAKELLERCETPSTPMLKGTAGPAPLTNREREVAMLAAAGLTSRAIGERLFLSVRTVDNHLAKIYWKVGVSRRSELADALGW